MSKTPFEELSIVEQMRLAAACFENNAERGACSPSVSRLRQQAEDCERWATCHEHLLDACKRAKKLLEPEVTKEPDRTIFWELVEAIRLSEGKALLFETAVALDPGDRSDAFRND